MSGTRRRWSRRGCACALARGAVAALGGAAVYASYEPVGLWVGGILGVFLLCVALAPWPARWSAPLGLWGGAGLGFVHSAVLCALTLPWIGHFVGALPYIALCVVLSLYGLATGAGGAALLRLRWGWLAFPFWLVAVEQARSSWPFGGFSWVRLAWGQVGGPLAGLPRLGGPIAVSAAVAVAGAAVWMMLRECAGRRWPWRGASISTCVAAVALVGGWPVSGPRAGEPMVTAAAVQGNVPRLGLDFNAQRFAVLRNHSEVTQDISQPVDLVIWPENAADVNPLSSVAARRLVDAAVAHVGAPVLVGTITRDEVGPRNTMLVFDPDTGPGERHNKKYLQPFGETMPYRDLLRHVTSLVDLAGDYQPGQGDGVVHMRGIPVGVATCYEVAFDAAYRDAVTHGAQILATPTNNATFGHTDMTYQQLAMSRMRAIELDRAVVVAATSGVSAIVEPDGTVTSQTGIFEPGVLVSSLPLRQTITPAARYGFWVTMALTIIGASAGVFAVGVAWVRHRGDRPGSDD